MIRNDATISIFHLVHIYIYIIVYVNDIISRDDHEGINILKKHLFNQCQTKDLRNLKYFFGIEMAKSCIGICNSQRKYALDILEETRMLGCRPTDTSMDAHVKFLPK